MTPSLSETFEPPSTTVYGFSGFSVSRSSTSSSVVDEQAGRARQQLGELVDARLLAVHDAEAVGDERVAERGELRGERRRARRRPSTVSPALKRRFSSSATSPSSSAATASLRRRRRRCRRRRRPACRAARTAAAATGARLYLASGAPSGRPRCEHRRRRVAPAWISALSVASDARTRPSSVIAPSFERNVQITADDDALAGERTRAIRSCAASRRLRR